MLGNKDKIKEIKRLKLIQEQKISDDYTVGIYNGLELALSVLEKREPDFKTFEKESEIIERENNNGRTIMSGIRRRGKM